jgi:hypothetical protein
MSLSFGREIESETKRRFSPISHVLRCYKLREIERFHNAIMPTTTSASASFLIKKRKRTSLVAPQLTILLANSRSLEIQVE